MKILMISLNAFESNTSAMIRNKALASGLVKNGAKVDFLTIEMNKNNNYYDDTRTDFENINIIRLEGNRNYENLVKKSNGSFGIVKEQILNVMRKIYHSINLFDNTFSVAKKIESVRGLGDYYDYIISSSDPKSSHLAARRLIEGGLKYGKWIQYWGDPLLNDITQKTILPKFHIKNVESDLLAFSDKIVYVSPFTLQEQKITFSSFSDKMEFLPIPYYKEKIYDLKSDYRNGIKLGYFGDYNSQIRDILPLYNYCESNGTDIIIAGNSDLDLVEKDNICIYPRVGKNKLEEFESESDVLVCILNKFGTQIPGKLYHYAASNKPVLVVLDGDRKKEIEDYLQKFNRFKLCENNIDSIKSAIIDIAEKSEEFKPSSHFDSKVIAKKILEFK